MPRRARRSARSEFGTCSIESHGKKTTIVCDSAAARKLVAAASHQPIPDSKMDALATKSAKAWKSRHDGEPMNKKGFDAAWKAASEDLARYVGVPLSGMAASRAKARFEEALSMALIDLGSSLEFESPAFRPREAKGRGEREEREEREERGEREEREERRDVAPGFPIRRDFGESNEPPMTEGAYGRAPEISEEDIESDRERFFARASDGLHSGRRRRHRR